MIRAEPFDDNDPDAQNRFLTLRAKVKQSIHTIPLLRQGMTRCMLSLISFVTTLSIYEAREESKNYK